MRGLEGRSLNLNPFQQHSLFKAEPYPAMQNTKLDFIPYGLEQPILEGAVSLAAHS